MNTPNLNSTLPVCLNSSAGSAASTTPGWRKGPRSPASVDDEWAWSRGNLQAPSPKSFTRQSVEHLTHLGDALWAQTKVQERTDLVVICQCGERKYAHSCIIAAAAPKLTSLFSSNEGHPERGHFRIHTDGSAEVVEALLRFLYTGSLPYGANTIEVMHLAHSHDIHRLTSHCATLLKDGLTQGNAVEVGAALLSCRNNDVARQAYSMAVSLTARGHLKSKPGSASPSSACTPNSAGGSPYQPSAQPVALMTTVDCLGTPPRQQS